MVPLRVDATNLHKRSRPARTNERNTRIEHLKSDDPMPILTIAMKSLMQSSGGSDRHAEVAYEQIAPVYDDFTAHHDYPSWIDSLLRLGRAHGLRGDTALDVGCGT